MPFLQYSLLANVIIIIVYIIYVYTVHTLEELNLITMIFYTSSRHDKLHTLCTMYAIISLREVTVTVK